MSTIGFYARGDFVCASAIGPAHLEFMRDRIADEAQNLANESSCQIDVWIRGDDGQQANHTGIVATPAVKSMAYVEGQPDWQPVDIQPTFSVHVDCNSGALRKSYESGRVANYPAGTPLATIQQDQ